MKCGWTLSVILAFTPGLLAQSTAAPGKGDTPSKATTNSKVAQSSNNPVVVARLDGDGSTGNKTSASNSSTDSTSKTETNASAATAPAAAPAAKPAANAEPVPVEDQVQQLRDQVVSQSKELAATREQLKQQEQKMQALEDQLKSSSAPDAKPSAAAAPVSSSVAAAPVAAAPAPANTDAGVSSSRDNAANPGSPQPMAGQQMSDQAPTHPEESPLQLKIGTAYITPVGFMDFTGVWRSRNGASGIGTNFAGVPYGTNTTYKTQLNEFLFSMQNSRIGFRVDANVKGSHVIGYMEADFLGNNPTNVAVSSNSNTLRSRLYWVDWRMGGWEVLAGQTWSLATPNRVGISPLPGDIFFSYNMDVNYQVGMVWGRIPEFRVGYHFLDNKAAFAVALAQPQQYVGGTNGSTTITPPLCCSYLVGGEANDGTTTLAVPNRAPDVISKLVFDPSKLLHVEVGGMARFFQTYNQTSKATFDKTGGAGFVNLDVGLGNSGLRVLSHNFWSDGGGRYIFGSAPDFIGRADLNIGLVHAGATVNGLEFTNKNTTVFGYWGLDYIQRAVAVDTNGCFIGWGYGSSPASLTGCTAVSSGQNRTIQEPTLGFINNFWKNPKFGALSLIGQVSYLTRSPWVVAAGAPKNAHMTMAWIDLRYTLPGSAPTLGKPGRE